MQCTSVVHADARTRPALGGVALLLKGVALCSHTAFISYRSRPSVLLSFFITQHCTRTRVRALLEWCVHRDCTILRPNYTSLHSLTIVGRWDCTNLYTPCTLHVHYYMHLPNILQVMARLTGHITLTAPCSMTSSLHSAGDGTVNRTRQPD